jgi:hypothetical protein
LFFLFGGYLCVFSNLQGYTRDCKTENCKTKVQPAKMKNAEVEVGGLRPGFNLSREKAD